MTVNGQVGWPSYKASTRALSLESPLREFNKYAKALQAQGKEIYFLNVGDPDIFDFDTPRYLKDAMHRVIEGKSGHYSPSRGDSALIKAIADRENKKNGLNLSDEDIFVTQGLSEAICFLFGAMIEQGRGDEILLPGPAYPPYIEWVKYYTGKPVNYRTVEENGWQPDVDDLSDKITPNTKAIAIINPNNPTGAVYSKPTVKKIIDIARENHLPIIADEIYDQLIFGETEHADVASLTKDIPVIGLNGFSKAYLMPGWRVGYVYFYDPVNVLGELKEAFNKFVTIRLSANTPAMKTCAEAFKGPQGHIAEMNRKLKERAEFAHKRLNEINRIETQKPEGAFYIFPKFDTEGRWKTDKEFCLDLLQQTGVYLPFGSGFDPVYGKGHARAVILPEKEILEEALDKLEEFMGKN